MKKLGTQQNTIVILGIVAAIVIVLFIAFRNFKLGDLLGLEKAQKDFDEWVDNTSNAFNEWVNGLGDFFSGFDPNALSGKTIDTSDQFGEGSTVTFGEGTTIDKEGRIDAPNGQSLDLGDKEENLVLNYYDRLKQVNSNTDNVIRKAKLTEDEISQINRIDTAFHKLGEVRDSSGLQASGFSAAEIRARATNVFLNNKRQAFKDKKSGKKSGYGGFSSAIEQEQALRDAIAKARKDNPEYFKKLDAARLQALQTSKKKQ